VNFRDEIETFIVRLALSHHRPLSRLFLLLLPPLLLSGLVEIY